ncbi:MAG: hypothetical protein ACE5LQ_00600 [Candidatus Bipolaricaulia bacterium]
MNPAIRVVSKTENAGNAIKLERAGADEVIACHDVGAEKMVEAAKKGEKR